MRLSASGADSGFSLSYTGSTAAIDDWAMVGELDRWGYYGEG